MIHPRLEYWPQKCIVEIGNIKRLAAKTLSAWGSYQDKMKISRLPVLMIRLKRDILDNVRQAHNDER